MIPGGDYATRDHVAELLYQIQKRLESQKVDADSRQEILDVTLPFIESSNAGLDDMLYDVAYFAGNIKKENLRRPPFQQEFARIVPGWRELN